MVDEDTFELSNDLEENLEIYGEDVVLDGDELDN